MRTRTACLLLTSLASLALAEPVPVFPLAPVGPRELGLQHLAPVPGEYDRLASLADIRLVGLPDASGAPMTLDLQQVDVFSPDARIILASPQGEIDLPRPDVRCYAGTITGQPDTRAFIGFTPYGASGFIQTPTTLLILSAGPGGNQPTVIFDTHAPAALAMNIQWPTCAGAVLPEGATAPDVNTGAGYGDRVGECRALRLAIDCDTEYTANLFGGDTAATTAYVATVVGAMTEIYKRDTNAGFELAYLRLWTGTDPYTAADNGAQLPEFRSYWNSNMGSVSRNLAHLFSARGLGGGIAYLGAACGSNAYGVSANLAGHFPYPILNNNSQNWDLMVTSHEIGHNVGSGHTHDPASYNPPVDGCGSAYLNPPGTQDCSVADADQGTIMSYCHVCPGGMTNMRMEFGPRPSTVIRSWLDARPSCGLTPSITITANPQPVTLCPGLTATFTVSASGTGARTYQWRRNTINIPGATSSTYSVATSNDTVGSYDCVISATCISSTSLTARLRIATNCPTCDPDLNHDGNADQDDVTYLINVVGGGANPSGANPDFNNDGNADQDDIAALILVLAGGVCP